MRVAVLSDIHANLVALDAVLASLGTVDAVWQLGDVVGYGPEPDGVVERLSQIGAIGVRGNHDAAAIGGEEIDYFNADARAAMEWTRGRISEATRAWLSALPERHTEGDFNMVHGSPREPTWEYIVSVPIARANLAVLTTPFGLYGHTHLPMVFAERDGAVDQIEPAEGSILGVDGRGALINPGSVGQPRDGLLTASFLIIDTDVGQCTWQRVAYDIAAVQAEMRSAGLPARLIERLSYGL
ncbi:MAG TPA: metallophosphoesterase family protein [Candidatus Limnocylindrales bacterium]|nr:metallophosphoesterase family protein [Candidatus Limnocylindrales bacterium]